MNNRSGQLSLRLGSGFDDTAGLRWRDSDDFKIVRRLSDHMRTRLVHSSILKHAKYHAFSSVLSLNGCLGCLADICFDGNNLGVIATGGPLHCDLAWAFTERAINQGALYVNPLFFPHTLTSSIPSSVASAVGAKAFAFSIGYDHHAFFELLVRAMQLIRFRYCEQVLTIAVFDANAVVLRAAAESKLNCDFGDTAVCGLLGPADPRGPNLFAHEVFGPFHTAEDLFESVRGKFPRAMANHFHVRIEEGAVVKSSFETQLQSLPAFTATGGVLLMETAGHMWRKFGANASAPFLVSCEADGRTSGMVLEWATE